MNTEVGTACSSLVFPCLGHSLFSHVLFHLIHFSVRHSVCLAVTCEINESPRQDISAFCLTLNRY